MLVLVVRIDIGHKQLIVDRLTASNAILVALELLDGLCQASFAQLLLQPRLLLIFLLLPHILNGCLELGPHLPKILGLVLGRI